MSLYISLALTIILIVAIMWCFYRYVDRSARRQQLDHIKRYCDVQVVNCGNNVSGIKGNNFSQMIRRSAAEAERDTYQFLSEQITILRSKV